MLVQGVWVRTGAAAPPVHPPVPAIPVPTHPQGLAAWLARPGPHPPSHPLPHAPPLMAIRPTSLARPCSPARPARPGRLAAACQATRPCPARLARPSPHLLAPGLRARAHGLATWRCHLHRCGHGHSRAAESCCRCCRFQRCVSRYCCCRRSRRLGRRHHGPPPLSLAPPTPTAVLRLPPPGLAWLPPTAARHCLG